MKYSLACTLAAFGMLAGSASAFAQASDSTSATGSVTIIRPITITKSADLAFGRIVKPTSGTGAVAIANSGDSVTAGSGAVALSGITTSRAKFTVDGEGGQAVTVTVPANFSMTNGANSISVTLDPDVSGSATLSNALGSAGSKAVNIGGTFSLPDTQASGAYSGTFNVTVAYQ